VSLAPGSYGDVLVHNRATLRLTGAGLYRFTSLTFEPDGFLSIAGDFDVALAVDEELVLGDRFEMAVNDQSTLDSDHLFLYSGGELVEYGHDSVFVGNLEAPLAHVEIRDRSFVRGALSGRSMTIGFDAVVGPRAAMFEPPPTCGDGVQNGGETGVDCGGSCSSCPVCQPATYQAETMFHSTGGSTPGGWNIWANGYISATHTFAAGPASITVHAKGQAAQQIWPHMIVRVGGVAIGSVNVNSTSFAPYVFNFVASGGPKEVRIEFDNDFYAPPADRNLLVDSIVVGCGGP
jgi:hypothetical protein